MFVNKGAAIFLILLMSGSLILFCNFDWAKAANPIGIEWTKTYVIPPNETVDSGVQTTDGGYAIAGSNLPISCLLMKTDSAGNQLWNKNYAVNSMPSAPSVIQTNDGGYAVLYDGGVAMLSGTLVKTDSTGNLLWNKSAGQGIPCSVIQTNDGGLVWGGSTYVPFSGALNYIWLNKTDSTGTILWSKTYDQSTSDSPHAYSIIKNSDGGFVLAGIQHVNATLIKTDSSGNEVWNKVYPSFMGFLGSLIQTTDGGYALVGYMVVGGTTVNYYLVKIDSSGNLQWSENYGLLINSIVQTADGYLFAGENMLTKTDSSGNLQWSQTFDANIARIITTSDGEYALVGTYSDAGATYSWLTHPYFKSNSDSHTHSNSNTFSSSNRFTHANLKFYSKSYTNGNPNSHSNLNLKSYAHHLTNIFTNSNCDTNADSHANANSIFFAFNTAHIDTSIPLLSGGHHSCNNQCNSYHNYFNNS